MGGLGTETIEIGGMSVRVGKSVAEGGFAFVHFASDAADHSRVFALKRIVCHEKDALADAVSAHAHTRAFAHAHTPHSRCSCSAHGRFNPQRCVPES